MTFVNKTRWEKIYEYDVNLKNKDRNVKDRG